MGNALAFWCMHSTLHTHNPIDHTATLCSRVELHLPCDLPSYIHKLLPLCLSAAVQSLAATPPQLPAPCVSSLGIRLTCPASCLPRCKRVALRLCAGCSNADIAAACKALASHGSASRLAVLKLGPPTECTLNYNKADACEGSEWGAASFAPLQQLLQHLPQLQALELWGLSPSQLSHAQACWAAAKDREVLQESCLGGVRLALEDGYHAHLA